MRHQDGWLLNVSHIVKCYCFYSFRDFHLLFFFMSFQTTKGTGASCLPFLCRWSTHIKKMHLIQSLSIKYNWISVDNEPFKANNSDFMCWIMSCVQPRWLLWICILVFIHRGGNEGRTGRSAAGSQPIWSHKGETFILTITDSTQSPFYCFRNVPKIGPYRPTNSKCSMFLLVSCDWVTLVTSWCKYAVTGLYNQGIQTKNIHNDIWSCLVFGLYNLEITL